MDQLKRLRHLNIEIEGLLHVLAERDNEDIRSLIAEKHNEFSTLLDAVLAAPADVCTSADSMSADNDAAACDSLLNEEAALAQMLTEDEIKDQEAAEPELPSQDELAEKAVSNDRKPDEGFQLTLGDPDVFVVDEDTEIMPQDEFEINTSGLHETAKVETAPEQIAAESAEPQTPETVQDEKDEPSPEAPTETTEPKPAPESKESLNQSYKSTPVILNDVIPSKSDDIRVDQAISRREANDLRRAFTLNDKFRFRRGLFGNNDSLFADTLNTLMAMHSVDEATDYLYNDMGWNPEDEDVKDFISIVRNHFATIA